MNYFSKILSFSFIAFITLSSTSCAQQLDPYGRPMNKATREEVKESYKEAARELGELAKEFKSFYSELKTTVQEEGLLDWGDKTSGYGPVDVEEVEDWMIVTMDLPGVNKKDISVKLRDKKILEIQARREAPSLIRDDGSAKRQHVSERYKGSYNKTVTLPSHASSKGIKADYKNGVLTVKVRKQPPDPESVIDISVD